MCLAVCLKSDLERLYYSSVNAVRQTLLRLWHVLESAMDTKCGVFCVSVLSELAARCACMTAST